MYKSVRQGQTCRVQSTITIALSGLPVEATKAQLMCLSEAGEGVEESGCKRLSVSNAASYNIHALIPL